MKQPFFYRISYKVSRFVRAMKKWILKALVQKIISFLPLSRQINYFFQKRITKGVYLSDAYFYDRLGHAATHLKIYQEHTNLPCPAKVLEIGTGWYPIVPISLFLVGSDIIYSIDIELLTSKEKIKTTIEKFVEAFQGNKLYEFKILPDRYKLLAQLLEDWEQHSFKSILELLHLYYVIEDARQISLPDDSIDLINSNNTFEHIYPKILFPILKEFKRIIKKSNGVMSHFIDMSDHFAHFDKSISIYNFLKFSDLQWRWIDNSIQPQNRLRIYDYYQMFEKLKLPVHLETKREGNVAELIQTGVHSKYQHFDLNEVAVSHCHFICFF